MGRYRVLAAVAAVSATAGCATQAKYEQVVNLWVGQPEERLIDTWGPPVQAYEAGSRKYLTYVRVSTVTIPGNTPPYRTSLIGGTQRLAPGGGTATALPMVCRTTFMVAGGRIMSWHFEGNGCKSV